MAKKYRDTIEDADFTGESLNASRYVPIAVVKATSKNWFAWGHGSRDIDKAPNAYAHATLYNDAGTPVELSGKLRFVVYESDQREEYKAILDTYDLQEWSDASSESRTNQIHFPIKDVGAKQDEVIGVELKIADSSNDGTSVDPSNSNTTYRIPTTRFRQ